MHGLFEARRNDCLSFVGGVFSKCFSNSFLRLYRLNLQKEKLPFSHTFPTDFFLLEMIEEKKTEKALKMWIGGSIFRIISRRNHVRSILIHLPRLCYFKSRKCHVIRLFIWIELPIKHVEKVLLLR